MRHANRKQILLLYAVTFILAGCSILYELLIAQTLSWFMANSVVWYSLTIGIYLGSLGIGAALFYKKDHAQDPFLILCRVEIFLSLLGGLSVSLIYLNRILFQYFVAESQSMLLQPATLYGVSLFICFLVTIGVGILTGKEIPALIAITRSLAGEHNIFNRILAVDCFGSCAGGFLFAMVLVPYFSLLSIAALIASANIFCLLLVLIVFCRKETFFGPYVKVGIVFACGFLILGTQSHHFEQYCLQKIYYQRPIQNIFSFLRFDKDLPGITRTRSVYQTIDTIPRYPQKLDLVLRSLCEAYSQKMDQGRFYEKGFLLAIDGDGQFHSDIEEFYHEYFVHIPIILQKKVPQKVLVLGGGDGMLIRELLKYPDIKRIDHVDIDPVIVHLSKTREDLLYLNEGALLSPKVHTQVQDGYHYLRTCPEIYDAIYLDFPIAYDYNVNKLYTREFYSFAKKHLKDGGYLVFDVGPLEAPTGNSRLQKKIDGRKEVYVNTIRAAGFQTILTYGINLESDNPQAHKILGRYYMRYVQDHGGSFASKQEMGERRKGWVQQAIKGFVQSQKDGYIFAVKEKRSYDREYVSFGIPLYALDQKRFKAAFSSSGQGHDVLDPQKINSIMRPTLLRM